MTNMLDRELLRQAQSDLHDLYGVIPVELRTRFVVNNMQNVERTLLAAEKVFEYMREIDSKIHWSCKAIDQAVFENQQLA